MASTEIKTLTLDGNAYGLNDTVAREQITQISESIDNKVDKISGKGLSTNDYTTAEKNKLAGLSNYTLPTASATIKGGVKVGSGINISADGTISVSESGGSGSSVPDSTITDVAPEYAASASYQFNVLNNREYRRLHLTDSIHAVSITFTTTDEINSRNEHYILVTNSAKSTTVGSIAVNRGSFSELIGMSEAVEIPVGKSVEFSFKVYSDGTNRALIVTHSDVL